MQPGGFQWVQPGQKWYLPPAVQERTREAALRAAYRIDPAASETHIVPTRLDLSFLYLPGDSTPLMPRFVRANTDVWTR
jgi:hypothetical protein